MNTEKIEKMITQIKKLIPSYVADQCIFEVQDQNIKVTTGFFHQDMYFPSYETPTATIARILKKRYSQNKIPQKFEEYSYSQYV